MTRYFNSGLYETTFYTTHRIDMNCSSFNYEDIGYDRELLAEHYKKLCYFVYRNECDKWEQVEQEFWDRLALHGLYFKPLVFKEEIALECSLTPFTYQGDGMLVLSSYGMDLSPRLDTYQALVSRTIDARSKLFSAPEDFKQIMGRELTAKVLRAISK